MDGRNVMAQQAWQEEAYKFQSSPALMDGRNFGLFAAREPNPQVFQSSPALMDGRNPRRMRLLGSFGISFNPRPP